MTYNRPFRMSIFFSFITLLAIFGSVVAQEANNTSNHIVLEITGVAEYRDTNWDNGAWQQLSVGLPVRSNWLIRPQGPSVVKILCAGGNETTTIREETATPGCIDIPEPVNLDAIIKTTSQRGDSANPNNVAILLPAERIATTTPTILWEETRDFENYRVSIIAGGLEIFTDDVQGTSYTITDESILQRGQTYSFSVTPISALNDVQFTFRDTVDVFVLSSDDFTAFATRSQQVEALTLQEVTNADLVTYTEAWTFYEYALFSEAANSLFKIITPDAADIMGDPVRLTTSPYPYILGGDTMRGTGLESRATVYYNKALSFAKSIEDYWLLALTLERLSVIETDSVVSACYANQAQILTDSLMRGNSDIDLEEMGNCSTTD